jgi:hypothetical protein
VRPVLDELATESNVELQQRAGEMRRLLERPDLWPSLLEPSEYKMDDEEVRAEIVEVPDIIDLGEPEDIARREEIAAPAVKIPPGAKEALRTADFVIYFEVQRNANNPRQIAIRATIFNVTSQPLGNFNIQYGVPVGWVLKLQSPTGVALPPNGERPLQQILMLENRGNAALMMKTHTTYMYGCQPLVSDSTLANIFE